MPPDRHYNSRRKLEQRRGLRSGLTPGEAIWWSALHASSLHGRTSRRQHGIGPYIVDFYCPAEMLIVELEGAAHEGARAARYDETRESFLTNRGLTVLRIENRHVGENLEGVLEFISQHF